MRPYTVTAAPLVDRALPGTTAWADEACKRSGGFLWNNGTYVKRDMRGRPGVVSNHARGLAMDLSYRHVVTGSKAKGQERGRSTALAYVKELLMHADLLGIELVIDYWGPERARIWKCDRDAWRPQDPGAVHGVPGDWFHIEISQTMSFDPIKVKAAWTKAFAPSTTV
jgi:hypothetical protein